MLDRQCAQHDHDQQRKAGRQARLTIRLRQMRHHAQAADDGDGDGEHRPSTGNLTQRPGQRGERKGAHPCLGGASGRSRIPLAFDPDQKADAQGLEQQ